MDNKTGYVCDRPTEIYEKNKVVNVGYRYIHNAT